jgi:hypothetical protein
MPFRVSHTGSGVGAVVHTSRRFVGFQDSVPACVRPADFPELIHGCLKINSGNGLYHFNATPSGARRGSLHWRYRTHLL